MQNCNKLINYFPSFSRRAAIHKKFPKKWKKSKVGGGGAKKSTIQNVEYFEMSCDGPNFQGFPKVKGKNMGEMKATFGTHYRMPSITLHTFVFRISQLPGVKIFHLGHFPAALYG